MAPPARLRLLVEVRDEIGLEKLKEKLVAPRRRSIAYWYDEDNDEYHEISVAYWLHSDRADWTLRSGQLVVKSESKGLLRSSHRACDVFVVHSRSGRPLKHDWQGAAGDVRRRLAKEKGRWPKLQADIELQMTEYFEAIERKVGRKAPSVGHVRNYAPIWKEYKSKAEKAGH